MVEQNGQCLCRRARSRHCRRRRATAVRVLGMRCCHQRVVECGSGWWHVAAVLARLCATGFCRGHAQSALLVLSVVVPVLVYV